MARRDKFSSMRNSDDPFGTKNNGLGGTKKPKYGSVLGKSDTTFGTKGRGLGGKKGLGIQENLEPVQPPMEQEPLDPDGRIPHERVQELEARIGQLETENSKINLFSGRLSALESRLTGNDPFYRPQMPRLEEGSGITITQYPNRVRFDVKTSDGLASGGVVNHPWKTLRADDGATKKVSVYPGTLSGLVPTNIFTHLTITGTGVEFVVLTGTVTGNNIASCALSIETTHPVPSPLTASTPPTSMAVVLAILSDGVVFQIRSTNLTAECVEVFREAVDTPDVGEMNYTPYYRWDITES